MVLFRVSVLDCPLQHPAALISDRLGRGSSSQEFTSSHPVKQVTHVPKVPIGVPAGLQVVVVVDEVVVEELELEDEDEVVVEELELEDEDEVVVEELELEDEDEVVVVASAGWQM